MKVKTTSFKNDSKETCFIWFAVRWLVWLRRLHGNWQRAARIPPDPAVASRRTDAHHRSGCGYSWGKLALVGGTLYFALMGVVMVIAAVLIFPQPPRRYSVIRRGVYRPVIWAISDAGWNYWPLFRACLRSAYWPSWPPWSGLSSPAHRRKRPGLWRRRRSRRGAGGELLAGCSNPHRWSARLEAVPVKPVAPGEQQKNWAHWGNTTHGDRFAALDQINKQNVNQLQVAWVAHTGDIPQSNGSGAEDQNTPLQIGDTLYVCTPYSKVLALDGTAEKRNGAMTPNPLHPTGSCRGLGITKIARRKPRQRQARSRPPVPSSVPADHRRPPDRH